MGDRKEVKGGERDEERECPGLSEGHVGDKLRKAYKGRGGRLG